MNLAEKITKDLKCFHKNGLIDLNRTKPGTESQGEYYYAHLPLALIDAVFSKGLAYSATAKVVNSYCDYFRMQRNRSGDSFPDTADQESISRFLKKFIYEGEYSFRTEIFKSNEPATSKVDSKSRAMAVFDFADLLHENGVEYFQDIEKVLYDRSFAEDVINVTGMTDDGLNYFFMLSGSDETVRPVRSTIDFINGISNDKAGHENSIEVVNEVCGRLKSEFSNITPRMLGFLIWEYIGKTKHDFSH
ncbi:MAG TPA: hypothetical protein PKG60_01250 [Spirochaetota bacterium]|nr:hypothetical protein [Spirochaetota bacterium]HPS86068.1 hypothetical protein [Spirochaetota bacterium]